MSALHTYPVAMPKWSSKPSIQYSPTTTSHYHALSRLSTMQHTMSSHVSRCDSAWHTSTATSNIAMHGHTIKLGDEHNFSLMASTFLVKKFAQTNVFAWICTAFVHLIIGCAIRYPLIGNLR